MAPGQVVFGLAPHKPPRAGRRAVRGRAQGRAPHPATHITIAGMTFESIIRRAAGLLRESQGELLGSCESPRVASGRQWRDDQGRPLAFLDKAGLHEEAARVRAAHGRRSAPAGHRTDEPREPAPKRRRAAGTPRAPGQLYCDEEDGLGDLEDNGSPFVECCSYDAHADECTTLGD
jgi:hypothetical protein